MFIEPDPRRTKAPSSGGFFSSQRPVISPRDRQRLNRKSANLKSKEDSTKTLDSEKPTVRLVQPSISLSPQLAEIRDSGDDRNVEADGGKEKVGRTSAESRLLPSTAVTKAGDSDAVFSALDRSSYVSKAHAPTIPANEALSADQKQGRAPSTTLLPNTSQQTLSSSEWHRRSTSSGWQSQCSTLQSSETDLARKSARSQRSSQVTTLRGTPTPYEYENQARAEAQAEVVADTAGIDPAQVLETLQEASPELATIRSVGDSDTSTAPSPVEPGSGSEGSHSRSHSAPADSPVESNSPISLPRTTRRALSTSSIHSLPSSPNFRAEASSSPVVQRFDSDQDASISEADEADSSSPNFVAYSPDADTTQRPISRTDLLRDVASLESIHSRLYRYSSATARPESGPGLRNQASWASHESDDTLPPLYIPRRRIRHQPGSLSLASQASSSRTNETMDEEDIDTQPYPRRPFSNHLSTIASESDSRTASQHLSHWSMGSGVLTLGSINDASSAPLTPVQEMMRRRGSAPPDSFASGLSSPPPPGTRESGDEPGNMTLDIFRDASAVPQPLFRMNTGPSMVQNGASNGRARKYDGPLPPLPPMPDGGESDEHYDTLSEMTRPSLHQKRSGYSLRARSNTTPGHSRQQSEISYSESERFSQGTSIFPTWAKRFYSGDAFLASKLSLSSLSPSELDRQQQRSAITHRRQDSSWTDRSITSRLGQTYSNTDSVSPTSSHFLPAIFRPRTRKRSAEQSRISKLRKSQRSNKSKWSRPSQDSRPDSMAITIEPLPPLTADGSDTERLPSGHPRYGSLQDPDDPLRSGPRRKPLRKYSKQGEWNHMEFPRPMTKDRLSDFSFQHHPRLAPSKRTSQNRLSFWQAPSFTESLSSLIHSRCNRQVLLFGLGFLMPLCWMLGAVLPLPRRPPTESDLEKAVNGSEDDVQAAMMRHEAGDAERRWREERLFLKAKWWRMLNRIMSFIGLLVIGAVVSLSPSPDMLDCMLTSLSRSLSSSSLFDDTSNSPPIPRSGSYYTLLSTC